MYYRLCRSCMLNFRLWAIEGYLSINLTFRSNLCVIHVKGLMVVGPSVPTVDSSIVVESIDTVGEIIVATKTTVVKDDFDFVF